MCSKLGYEFDAAAGMLRSPDIRSGSDLQAKSRLRGALRIWGVALVLASLALEVGGCNGWFRPVSWSEMGPKNDSQPKSPFAVVPKECREMANLSPDDIVAVMKRIGFADEQILELGMSLHHALATSGGARVTYRREPLAAFWIEGDYVQVRSKASAFQYQISTGEFVSIPQGGY